jgi:hypothetical protein
MATHTTNRVTNPPARVNLHITMTMRPGRKSVCTGRLPTVLIPRNEGKVWCSHMSTVAETFFDTERQASAICFSRRANVGVNG